MGWEVIALECGDAFDPAEAVLAEEALLLIQAIATGDWFGVGALSSPPENTAIFSNILKLL